MRIGFDIAIFEARGIGKHLFHRFGRSRWPNKSWEIEAFRGRLGNLLSFGLNFSTKGDHAGLHVEFCVLGFEVQASFNDNRHWDYENNTWEKYDEESMRTRMGRDEQRKVDDLERAYMLVNEDRKILTKKNAEDFLETPQGQAMIEQRAKAKLVEQRDSKEAKAARGEAYRIANLGKISDDEAHNNAKGNGQ